MHWSFIVIYHSVLRNALRTECYLPNSQLFAWYFCIKQLPKEEPLG